MQGGLWKNPPVIRVSLSDWVTTTADIERSVKAFVLCREKARQGLGEEKDHSPIIIRMISLSVSRIPSRPSLPMLAMVFSTPLVPIPSPP